MRAIWLTIAATVLLACPVAAETLRDSSGRDIGSRETLSSGRVVIRDRYGRETGTEETSSSGVVTRRNAYGQSVGTRERTTFGETVSRDQYGRVTGTADRGRSGGVARRDARVAPAEGVSGGKGFREDGRAEGRAGW